MGLKRVKTIVLSTTVLLIAFAGTAWAAHFSAK